jgi:hypothetical protein
VIRTSGGLSSVAAVPGGAPPDYFESLAHYEAVARRIVAALHGGNRPFVLVTGDPPANPQVLCEALGNVVRPGYAVIIISCGPELGREAVDRMMSRSEVLKAVSGVAADPAPLMLVSPLCVFDDFDRLSDLQIEDIFEDMLRGDERQPPAVLLAPLDFLVRLKRPALQFLKERIAVQFRFQEVGDDEAIAVLHNQLLSRRDRRIEARGFRHGIVVGLAAGAVLLVTSIGAFILHPSAEQVCEAPASTGRSSSASEKAPILKPAAESARSIVSTRASPTAETTALTTAPPISSLPAPAAAPSPSAPLTPPTQVENPPPAAPPAVLRSPPGHRLSAAEIAALLARGDAFLGTGDITSARLFYERAAEAESGLAALRLGATFDTVFPGPAGVRAPAADQVQALFWYRRARDLGVDEAAQRIKALEARPPGDANTRSR